MAGSIPTWPPVQPQFNYIMWQVLIRLNPELGAGGGVHPYLATGTASAKFGVPMGQLKNVLAILATSTKIAIVGK